MISIYSPEHQCFHCLQTHDGNGSFHLLSGYTNWLSVQLNIKYEIIGSNLICRTARNL